MAEKRALKDRGTPEGSRRFTAVFDRADFQLLHDWAFTAHIPFHTVLAKAITEYIDAHVREAAMAGLKVKRPKKPSENTPLALAKYADFYEDEDASSPFDRYI